MDRVIYYIKNDYFFTQLINYHIITHIDKANILRFTQTIFIM